MIKKEKIIGFLTLTLLFTSVTFPDIKVKTDKINDRIFIYRLDKPGSPTITAVSTKKGIVVIDTHFYSDFVEEVRVLIEKDLGEKKVAYVLNTHHHFDHTGGNQFFPEAVIIGHENSIESQNKFNATKDQFISRRQKSLSNLKQKIKNMKPGSTELTESLGRIKGYELQINEVKNKYKMVLPEITFADEMSLNMGDMTFRMKLFDNLHTNNDIIIWIAEEGLVFTGDIFWKGKLTFAENVSGFTSERYLRILDHVLNYSSKETKIIEGHWITSREEIQEKKQYIITLQSEIRELLKKKKSHGQIKNHLELNEKFQTLKYFDINDPMNIELHKKNLAFLLKEIKLNSG